MWCQATSELEGGTSLFIHAMSGASIVRCLQPRARAVVASTLANQLIRVVFAA